jgi:glycerate kinase
VPELKEGFFNIACDVTNPLSGEKGCSAVFGPQKGATEQMIKDMDSWLENYAEKALTVTSQADKNHAGAGAAGGLGFAFSAYLSATLRSGIELILDKIGIENEIKTADLVITGEGRIDAQTVMGKAPIGIARLAKKHGKSVVAFCGCTTRDSGVCNSHGIDAIFPILRAPSTLDEAMDSENARKNMADTAEQVIRLYLAGR